MITGDQVGMARRLLGWSRITLSGRSGVSEVTIDKIEKGKLWIHAARVAPNIAAIQRALESAGVEFTLRQPGVKLSADARAIFSE
jgi:transcriptional regulator with XRE-family HTH domain